MSPEQKASLLELSREFEEAVRQAADSLEFSHPIDGWAPDENSARAVIRLTMAAREALRGATGEDVMTALLDFVPPRHVVEDHGFPFDRFPGVSARHRDLQAANSAVVADLLGDEPDELQA